MNEVLLALAFLLCAVLFSRWMWPESYTTITVAGDGRMFPVGQPLLITHLGSADEGEIVMVRATTSDTITVSRRTRP